MKTKWIKTSDKLPDTHYISDMWDMSREVLVYTYKRVILVGYLNIREGNKEWVYNDYCHDIDAVTHWQPLEAPCLEN